MSLMRPYIQNRQQLAYKTELKREDVHRSETLNLETQNKICQEWKLFPSYLAMKGNKLME